jgi:hypothetical protein
LVLITEKGSALGVDDDDDARVTAPPPDADDAMACS